MNNAPSQALIVAYFKDEKKKSENRKGHTLSCLFAGGFSAIVV